MFLELGILTKINMGLLQGEKKEERVAVHLIRMQIEGMFHFQGSSGFIFLRVLE